MARSGASGAGVGAGVKAEALGEGGTRGNAKHTADLHRLLRIITLVQGERRFGPQELADHLGVAKRTLYRDIKKLQATGIPIEFDKKLERYTIGPDFFLAPMQFTAEEALALAALCGEVGAREGIGCLKAAARALAKIEAQLPAELRDDVRRVTEHVVIQTGATEDGDAYADVYERVRLAILARRPLRCVYESRRGAEEDEAAEFLFEPYALFFSVRAWYAVGRRDDRDGLRTMRLSRFLSVKEAEGGGAFEIPEGFSVQEYLGNAWQMVRGEPTYRVELLFDPKFGRTIDETRWHRTQEVEQHEDGSATFRCTVDGLDEIVWWVLSQGPHCRVIAPPELAERVRSLARETAALYGP